MKSFIQVTLIGIGITGAAGSAVAHHSGRFFTDDTVTLTGTVKEMQLTNPHSWLEIMVPNEEGALVQWSIEMSAPIVMFRRGWSRSTLTPGDEVTVLARPMRDGRPGAAYVAITLPDGSTLGRVDPTD